MLYENNKILQATISLFYQSLDEPSFPSLFLLCAKCMTLFSPSLTHYFFFSLFTYIRAFIFAQFFWISIALLQIKKKLSYLSFLHTHTYIQSNTHTNTTKSYKCHFQVVKLLKLFFVLPNSS